MPVILNNGTPSALATPLRVRLLGRFEIVRGTDHTPLALHRKVQAILAYLATQAGQAHGRESLATMFWPERDHTDARNNLRQALHSLRQALGPYAADILWSDREHIRFSISSDLWIDITAFSQATAPCAQCTSSKRSGLCAPCLQSVQRQFELYRGEFLTGLNLPDAPDFDLWCAAQRERLLAHALSLSEQLCAAYEQRQDRTQALFYAQRCIAIQPWNEASHRRYMRLLADCGQHASVRTWYENYCRKLITELNTEPDEATQVLFHHLTKNTESSKASAASKSPPSNEGERKESGLSRSVASVVCCHIRPRPEAEDPLEAIADARKAIFDSFAQYGAYITPGHDCYVFAYLGYPLASDTAADYAALALLQLRHTYAQHFMLRAGIYTGPVISSSVPAVPDLTGVAAREALRLAQHAAPNEVLVDATTQHILSTRFIFAAHTQTGGLKNEQCFALLAGQTVSRDVRVDEHLDSPLIGRRQETAWLKAKWKTACAGQRQTLLIRGEAGVGKSRLVRDLYRCAKASTAAVRKLHCLPEHQHTPLFPMIALFESLCQFKEGDSPATRNTKLLRYLREMHPKLGEDAASVLSALLMTNQSSASAPPRLSKLQTIVTVLALIDSLATHGPLLLIIEDIQWLDASSRDILAHIAQLQTPASICIVLTSRERTEYSWLDEQQVLALSPLPKQLIIELLNRSTTGLDSTILTSIAERSDGIPLYALELASSTAQTSYDGHAIPLSLHYSLLARLDTVPQARRVLQYAASIGRYFEPDLLECALGWPSADVEGRLDQLARAGLIEPRPGYPQHLQFCHALIQEAAYESQVTSDRQEAHKHIVDALCASFPQRAQQHPTQVAHHYTQSGNVAKAIHWWLRAGQQALHVSAYHEASQHLGVGLTLIDELQANKSRTALELELLLHQGQALLALYGYGAPAAIKIFDRAMALNNEDTPVVQRFETLLGLWTVSSSRPGFSFDTSESLACELLTLARTSGHPYFMAEAYAACTNIAVWRKQLPQAVQHARACLQYTGSYPSPSYGLADRLHPHVAALAHLSWAYARQGEATEARRAARQAIDRAAAHESAHSSCFALLFAALFESFENNLLAVESHSRHLQIMADMHHMALWQGAHKMMMGWIDAFRGKAHGPDYIEAAIVELQQAMPSTTPAAYHLLARAYNLLGQHDRCQDAIERGLRAALQVKEEYFKAELLVMRTLSAPRIQTVAC